MGQQGSRFYYWSDVMEKELNIIKEEVTKALKDMSIIVDEVYLSDTDPTASSNRSN